MRNLITAVALLFATATFGQDYKFEVEIDDMSEKTYFLADPLVKLDHDSNKGFRLELFYNPNTKKANTLYIKHLGLSNCSSDDKLIIMFEDGSKMYNTSFNKYNCDGKALFFLTKKDVKKLKSMAISKVRITSGNTFSQFTVELEAEEKAYFIQMYASLHEILSVHN